jgi:hypothetical protein
MSFVLLMRTKAKEGVDELMESRERTFSETVV